MINIRLPGFDVVLKDQIYQSVLSQMREVYDLTDVKDIIRMIRAEDMFNYRMRRYVDG